ncbi:MAG: enoyl-CoA hydratase/isomerase family protein [Dehalococcoidales bacterium]|nr:MAG: enoyl-CoA hydratase/isomerase family protein [Dehalococcoidales bacterium]
MTYEDLLLEKREDGVAILTLNVPEKLNALSRDMSLNLPLATDELAKDDNVRVVIVTGAGRGFCSGADVSMMPGAAAGGGAERPPRHQRLQVTGESVCDAFPKLDKPVIAAINGACAGAGLSLALSCDIRIASENARFVVAQVARALVPDYGMTYYLPVVVGMSKALELMFTADIIGAAEAERIGLVSKVVPLDELMSVADELALKIAAQPPISVEMAKRMVWQSRFDDIARQVDMESRIIQLCFGTEDVRASVEAFINKQPPPKYKGY